MTRSNTALRPLAEWLQRLLLCVLTSVSLAVAASPDAADDRLYDFDDSPRAEVLRYPDWFNDPFLDLPADLAAAREAGKKLIIYFGQKRCAYCHQLMDVNFGSEEDIVEYTRRHFEVTPIDIWGVAEVTDLAGRTMTERGFALRNGADFTPTLIFYDELGTEVLRLRGYYPPYQFRAALEYVADAHYQRESFRDYLARGENRMVFDETDLNDQPFFQQPPFNLDRSQVPGERPLAVFFEQGDCHPCDVLHGQALREPAIARAFAGFDSVQLNMWSQTPVVTPAGERTTAQRWAEDLGLYYAPAVIFFDEQGDEILRLDSVVGFYRLRNVLNYISSRAYLQEPSYQRWRMQRAF
ncbi:thioredoxin family protein [Halochromatium glycolicum]|jgi:thioredoxin-related protein|uniref:Thioredoxin n=1 Tax=Halochromatium glycolicum TaxID=85075 RepID=A0AAJ0U1I7_9GAMM|nr:thioredoxin fold domain-containing protein [Halochromatium glycolicum]MBK1703541.1 thioredoxin [Halochromatium glycolicum]